MSNWTRDSDNIIVFTEKDEKYDLFLKPEVAFFIFLIKNLSKFINN